MQAALRGEKEEVVSTGFPRYSRGLRSWKIVIREYQNSCFKPKIDILNLAKNSSFPSLFAVFKSANSQNREYQTRE